MADRDVQALTFGAYGCAHLGYAMSGLTRTGTIGGMNQRRIDAMLAHDAIISAAVTAGVDVILNLGDTFHTPRPYPEEAQVALHVDETAVRAGIPRYLLPGNHDVHGCDDVAATAIMHRPALGSHSTHLGVTGPVGDGPVPGRYARYPLSTPQGDRLLLGGKPVILHVVTPQGLPSPALTARGIVIDPRPVDGAVNVLLSHGIVDTFAPGLAATAGPGRVIPGVWLDRGFDLALFGDIHTPGPVPGHRTPAWYVGSSVRRGFSDPDASRGWAEVTLSADADPVAELHPIWQRPQRDLAPIDCASLTPDQARDAAAVALDAQVWSDPASEQFTGDGGYLLRQPFLNTTPAHRAAIGAAKAMLVGRAVGALYYATTCPGSRPTDPAAAGDTGPATSTAGNTGPAGAGLTRTETVPEVLARLAADPDSEVAQILADFTPDQQQDILTGTSRNLEGK